MLLEFQNVSKSFGPKAVLHGVSFAVHEGDCLALLGRSGCGKSTLLKILLGVYKADSGTVLFRGKPVDHKQLIRLTGYASQENSFYDMLTVRENIKYYSSRDRVNANVHALAKSVQLENALDAIAGSLSGGMKRRLDIALALLKDPVLMILDEPTTGLDPLLVEDFWRLVRDFRTKGKTILVVTHMLEDVACHCNKAVIMKHGSISAVLDHTAHVAMSFRRHA
jgi:ABC-2 type transport system ATP-binding protein